MWHQLERKRNGSFLSSSESNARKKRRLFGPSARNDESIGFVTNSDSSLPCSSIEEKSPQWSSGRRVVELGHIAKQMECTDCKSTLNLKNTESETRRGLGSTLYINCSCGIINAVTTNKSHRLGKRGPQIFDVNTKAAIAMMHSGTAFRQVNNLMAAMEVPGLDPKTMKLRESEVSEHINEVAKKSCTEALNQEAEIINSQRKADPPTPVTSQFKYDMGWQKRGSGRSYNSNSGVGTMISNKTGKIVAFDARIKSCRKCTYYNNRGQQSPLHDCVKNWDGSSKAMEADVGASLVKEVEKNNIQVDVMIMDDDCTTMARINSSVSHKITKWSDLNHTKKHLGNNLYSLQKKHKCLTSKVIRYFQKCFSYAVSQNKENPRALEKALQQIVPHAFGDHSCCDNWCEYSSNPETYKHKATPYGRDLVGDELKSDLQNVFDVFIRNVYKIALGASTKDVESFNNLVSSKAPKRIHFSGSSSLKNRVNCAVSQKYLGYTYVGEVNKAVCISPGKFYNKLAVRQDKERARRLKYENTKAFKKRKLANKLKQNTELAQKELHEGVTYKSGVANKDISEDVNIPEASTTPTAEKVTEETQFHKVFCDIETTSLRKDCDITQIAAVFETQKFNQYVLPSQAISAGASVVTHLKVINNVMYHNGQPVQSVNLKEALALFLQWLQSIGQCLLVGHNFFRFDLPRLLRSFENCKMLNAFQESVVGFADTYLLYKSVHPGLQYYNQEYLVKHFLNVDYNAHDALADVESLQTLVCETGVDNRTVLQHSTCTSGAISTYQHNKMCEMNLCTLEEMIIAKAISKDMAKKVASSGLKLSHLKLAVRRNGFEGLCQLFQEKMKNGKPRVTSVKKIINTIYNFVEKL